MGEWGKSSTVAIATLLVVTSMVGGIPIGSVAGASSSSTPVAVFADGDDTITVLYEDGSTKGLGVTGEIAGPMKNLDGDQYLEVPYSDGSSDLNVVDTHRNHQTVVTDDAKTAKNYLATGDWDDDGQPAIFYENTSNGKLYRVEVGSNPDPVVGPDGNPLATNGPVGIADFDDDGDEDILFLGSSSTLKYYDGNASDEDTKVESTGFSSFGSNNGLGIGAPADFNNDGKPRVPYVTGSKNLALIDASGSKTKLNGSYGHAAKTTVAAADWTGDDTLELLHVNTDNDNLYFSYLNGTVEPVLNSSGAKLTADVGFGVYPSVAPPAPDISDYDVSNPTGRELQVTFNSTEQLTNITVEVDGPETFNLTEGDFTETDFTDGPYGYTATTTVSTDGNYTATLTVAEDADGANGASGQNETVEIQTPYPTVTDVTLADAPNDDDEAVAGGDTLNVTATVTNQSTLTSVTADASAFGAGTVTLSHVSGDTYEGQFTVDASNAGDDGATDVTVTATNEYDHSDTNTSGTVVLDTTAPNADAGPDVTIEEDTSVTLDGDGSTDNTAIETYTWTFDDDHTESGVTTTETFADPGTYTVDLTVTDEVGLSSTDTVTVTVENVTSSEVNFTVTDTSLTDASNNDGYVAGGDEVRVTATVDSEYAVKDVRADASAFGAGTVTLSQTSGNQYAATFTVDAGDASDDGETNVTVTAVDEYDHVATATTETVFLDTTAPTADAGANLTVEEDTRVVFDGAGSSDNAKISRYVWTLANGTTVTGVTPARTYEQPGTYTVDLAVFDPVGHSATDSVTVDVTDVVEETTTTTEVVYVESDDDDDATENDAAIQTRNRTVTNGTGGTTVVRVRNVDANASVRFDLPVENRTAADLRTVTVVTDHDGDARLWITPNASAPANVTALGVDRHVDPVGYWNLTTHNARSATLAFDVSGERLGAAGPDAVSLYRLVDGAWERIDAQHVRTADGDLRFVARVPDLSGTGIFGVGVRHGSLDVTDLRLSEQETVPGRRVVLRATVANDGARTATETLALTVDGTVVADQTVTVPADSTRNATFAFAPESSGDYALSVGSEEVALSATDQPDRLRETAETDGEPAPEPEPAGLPFRAIAALSMAAVGIAYELAMAGGLESLLG